MDERDNKALNDGFSIEKASVRLIKAANSMFNPGENIQVRINTPGGDYQEALKKRTVRIADIVYPIFKEMSKTEETNKLSAEEYLDKYLAEFEEEAIPMERYGLLHFSESFASMRVGEAKKEWEKEKVEIIKEYQDEVDAFKSILYSKED